MKKVVAMIVAAVVSLSFSMVAVAAEEKATKKAATEKSEKVEKKDVKKTKDAKKSKDAKT